MDRLTDFHRQQAPSRRRHCRRCPVLELCACARRRPTAPVGSLGPGEAPALACSPHCPFPPHVPEPPRPPPPATIEPRRRPTHCLHFRPLPILGEPRGPLSRLPGRQSRQLAGDRPCPRRPAGQGPDCVDFNSSRVHRVNYRAWL
jgi:hypothetical protein